MAARPATCVDCGAGFTSGERGKLPTLCQDCRYAHSLLNNRAWKDRNPEHMAEYRRQHYADRRDYYTAKNRAWRAANRERVREYRRWLYLERQQATNTERVAEYRRANPGKHSEIENRRRARFLDAFIEPVDPVEVRRRSEGKCGICTEPVSVKDQSLDHITPLSKGGTHEYANVQLAHRVCNSRKGDRLAA